MSAIVKRIVIKTATTLAQVGQYDALVQCREAASGLQEAQDAAADSAATASTARDEAVSAKDDAIAAASTATAHIARTDNPHAVTAAQVGLGSLTNDSQVKRAEMGAASGVATLDSSGNVPAGQLGNVPQPFTPNAVGLYNG